MANIQLGLNSDLRRREQLNWPLLHQW